VQFRYPSQESIMKTIELLGTELIPRLEKLEIETTATVAQAVPTHPKWKDPSTEQPP
jgi:hypothetical protein